MKKLAVVTGGSQGIGKALVMKLVAEGFSVATCARREALLHDLRQEVQSLHPQADLLCFSADVSCQPEVERFAEAVQQQHQPVALLVNNAGVFIPGQIHSEEPGVFEQTMHTNLFSAYYLTRSLIGAMMNRRQGHIFNVCSTASITAYANGGSYCVSKFAMLGMSKVLREEMKPYGIRVTSVLPGATLTESWSGTDLPEDRFMPPEDVAEAILSAYRLSGRAVVEEIVLRPQLGDIG